MKYYMYYLQNKGIENIKAKIDFPLLRETKEIFLEENDKKILENVIKNIGDIARLDKPPKAEVSKICKKCSYYDLCYV